MTKRRLRKNTENGVTAKWKSRKNKNSGGIKMENYDEVIRENNLKKIENAIREDKVNHTNIYGETTLMFAVGEGYPDKVRKLIAMGADVQAKACSLSNALMYLTDVKDKSLNKEILEILTDNGAQLNCRNSDGDTILSKAIKENNIGMVENLLCLDNIDREQTADLKEIFASFLDTSSEE